MPKGWKKVANSHLCVYACEFDAVRLDSIHDSSTAQLFDWLLIFNRFQPSLNDVCVRIAQESNAKRKEGSQLTLTHTRESQVKNCSCHSKGSKVKKGTHTERDWGINLRLVTRRQADPLTSHILYFACCCSRYIDIYIYLHLHPGIPSRVHTQERRGRRTMTCDCVTGLCHTPLTHARMRDDESNSPANPSWESFSLPLPHIHTQGERRRRLTDWGINHQYTSRPGRDAHTSAIMGSCQKICLLIN